MKTPQSYRKLANRHVAKLLDKIEEVQDLSELVKEAIRSEFHYLADDIHVINQQGDHNGEINGNR